MKLENFLPNIQEVLIRSFGLGKKSKEQSPVANRIYDLSIGSHNGESSDVFAVKGNRMVVCDVAGSGDAILGGKGKEWIKGRLIGENTPSPGAYIDVSINEGQISLEANENGFVGFISVRESNELKVETVFHRLEFIDPDHPTAVAYHLTTDTKNTGKEKGCTTEMFSLRKVLESHESGIALTEKILCTAIIPKQALLVFAATDGFIRSLQRAHTQFRDPQESFTAAEHLFGRALNASWNHVGRDKEKFLISGINHYIRLRKEIAKQNPENISDDLLLVLHELSHD